MFTSSMPNLYCADVAASTTFYRDLLGLTQTYQYPPNEVPCWLLCRSSAARRMRLIAQ